MERGFLDSWPIRKQNELGSNAGELKITLIRKPLDHKEDQMTWVKVGELILTPTPPVKGFTINKILKLKKEERNIRARYHHLFLFYR